MRDTAAGQRAQPSATAMFAHARVVPLLVVAALVLASCGSTATSPDGPAPSTVPTALTTLAVSKSVERGPSDFTGNFMTDNRPYWMGWLALPQSGVSVTGSMITVEPDGKGSTKATTATVNGTTDGGSVVSLTTGSFLGTTGLTFSGRRSGDEMTLTYADKTGQLQAPVYRAVSQAAFNDALSSWQAQLAAAKGDADRAAAEKKATDDRNAGLAQAVKDRSNDLRSWISNLTSYNSRLLNDIASAKDHVNGGEQDALKTLQGQLVTLRKDSTEPLSQYQACSSVSYEFNSSMNYTFSSSLAYSRNQFASVATGLDTALAAVGDRIRSAQNASKALGTAIAASPLGVTGVASPGDEAQVIKTYSATADSVTKQLADLRATDAATYAAAQNLVAQGQAIWNTVKANHRC